MHFSNITNEASVATLPPIINHKFKFVVND